MENPKIPSFFAENISYFNKVLEQAFAWFLGNFGTFLFILFIGLITILVARNVNLLMESYLKKASGKLRMDITAFQMFRHIMVAVIYFVGIIVIIFSIPSLSSISVALFTGAVVVGIVIDLAAQSTLSNIQYFTNCSTSPTGSENHLASFRFQNTFLLNVWNRNGDRWFSDPVGEVL